MKKSTKLKKKLKQNQDLATKALKNKPEWKAAKGYKYLKDCKPGTKITTSFCEAILIRVETGGSIVIITEWYGADASNNMGKVRWANKTEVKEVS